MQNSVNHAPGLKYKVCPRLLSEVIQQLASEAGLLDKIDSFFQRGTRIPLSKGGS